MCNLPPRRDIRDSRKAVKQIMATSSEAEPLETLLERHFGFTQFKPGQPEVMRHLLAGRSAAAVFPTGGGKSLCYQLPALLLPGLTLVVSPLIALMKDQIDSLTARGIAARRLDSTLGRDDYRAVVRRRPRGPAAAVVRRARALRQRALLPVDPPHRDLAVRGRRGALHQRVGAQLPSRLSQAGLFRQVLPGRARAGPDRHGHPFGVAATSAAFSRSIRNAPFAPGSTGRISRCGPRRSTRRSETVCCWSGSARESRGRRSSTSRCSGPRKSWPTGSAPTAFPRGPITPAWKTTTARRSRSGSSNRTAGSWWPRSPSAWASTRPTSATSITTTRRRAWKTSRKRSAAPGRDGQPAVCETVVLQRRSQRAGELRLRRHAHGRSGRRAGGRGVLAGRIVRRRPVRAVGRPRHPRARGADVALLPGVAGLSRRWHAVLFELPVQAPGHLRGNPGPLRSPAAAIPHRAVPSCCQGQDLVPGRRRANGARLGVSARPRGSRPRLPGRAGLAGSPGVGSAALLSPVARAGEPRRLGAVRFTTGPCSAKPGKWPGCARCWTGSRTTAARFRTWGPILPSRCPSRAAIAPGVWPARSPWSCRREGSAGSTTNCGGGRRPYASST